MNNIKNVSIIIPCRKEEKFIGKCLDSIIANDYPKDRLEVLVVDGMSEDKTRQVVEGYTNNYPFIRLLSNPRKVTPVAMNLGIQNSKGDIVIFVNAHSMLGHEFIKYCVKYHEKVSADGVGGRLNTINEELSLTSHAITAAADSIFGSGGRRYRSRTREGYVSDTIPYCAYRRGTFEKYGYIDEELIRDQDEEFNYRILRKGGKLFFTPKIISFLYLRPTLKSLWRQHYQYGFFKPLVARKVGIALMWRQMVPALFVASLLVTGLLSFFLKPFPWVFLSIVSLYALVNLAFSFLLSVQKGIKYFPVLPIAFATIHVGYGLGYLKGILSFILFNRRNTKKIEGVPLTR